MNLETLTLPLQVNDKGFRAGIAAAAAGVTALVAGMGLAVKATFKWAGELDSIQDIMGVTNKTAAALNFTLRKSGTSTEALTKGMTILSKGLVKADGSLDSTGKSLKAWGINVLDANGMLKDQTTLIGEISDKYATFSTQQEKVNFLTETFGRSGAELIDFFDTLAADGGIDVVADKMERLGLAIDPNRYEQFNRNLEELKLIGLSLAVGFTEKVMPVIEKFLGMISDPKGIDFGKIAAWADTTIGVFIKGLGDSVNNWVSSGGPEALTESLIGWIEGIGDSEATKTKTQIAMEHLVLAIGNALREVDWESVKATMGEKIRELFAANQPEGENAVRDFWNNLEVTGTDGVRDFLNKQEATLTTGLKVKMPEIFLAGGTAAVGNLLIGLNPALGLVTNILAELKTGTDDKLREIAKTFYNRALAWGSQMVAGFKGSQGSLLSAISSMVQTINGLLKKIITSFHLTITYGAPTQSGSLGGGNRPRPNASAPPAGGGGGGQATQFASGGSFVVPSRYGYEGFGMGGIATASGGEHVTITPKGQQQQNVTIDEGRLARVIVQALMQAGAFG